MLLFLHPWRACAHEPGTPGVTRFEFIENKGQWNNPSLYFVQLHRADLYIEKNALQYFFYDETDMDELTRHPRPFSDLSKPYNIKGHALRISFAGSSAGAQASASEPFAHYYNYFLGNDSRRWKQGVKPYAQVSIGSLYAGIGLKLYTHPGSGGLKYDLTVQPGANPANIRMQYEGASNMYLKNGELYAETSVRSYIELKPYAYQLIGGRQVKVKCRFRIEGASVGFELGRYDPLYPLVIDPEVIFSTYSGSSADNFGHTATYDNDGNFYTAGIVTLGSTPDRKYPTTAGAFQQNFNGGFGLPEPYGFPCDIAISKYNNDGSALIYATYLGGNDDEFPHSLVVDKQNRLIVLGSTHSRNYPVSASAYDPTFNSPVPNREPDIVLTKFNDDGTNIIGSTYIGGSAADGMMVSDPLRMNYADEYRGEVQVNANNEIIVASTTASSDFPVTSGAFQTTYKGRQEACVFKFDSTLSQLKWSSFLGSFADDAAYSLDIDSVGNVYVAGGTQSNDFPTTAGVYNRTYKGGSADGFIARISANGSTLQRSMLWGSKKYDQAYFVKLDTKGKVNVMGQNYDSMPVTAGVYSNAKGSLYISRFSHELDQLDFSTVIGNGLQTNALSPSAFMVDACGNLYASCWGGETNFSGRGAELDTSFKSYTAGLPLKDALQPTTDSSDFYLFVLRRDAASLFYASYLGEFGNSDHVDGGTSRFDKRGIIYQSICASCSKGGSGKFPTTAGSYSPKNKSPRCSNVSYKLDFRLSDAVTADFRIQPRNSCTDTVVNFINNSYNGKYYYWYQDGVLQTTAKNYSYTFPARGTHQVKLIAIDSSRCIIIDSITKTINIGASSNSDFTITRDSCSFKVSFINHTIVAHGDSVPYFWQFGDGDTSTQKDPVHTYKASNTYSVRLISNPNTPCADTTVKSFRLDTTKYMLEPGFLVTPRQSCLPSKVAFKDNSINGKHYYWYYDQVLKDSTKQFTDSFTTVFSMQVKLVVIDSVSCKKIDSTVQTVETLPGSHPNFTIVPDTCGRTFSFTNLSTSYNNIPVSYLWEFGDGDTSVLENPTHKYLSNGSFVVRLTCNAHTFCATSATDVINYDSNAYYIVANFQPPPFACSPDTVLYKNLTQSHGQKFYWYRNGTFLDSTFDVHDTLSIPNLYRIKLVAMDSNTCNVRDSITKNLFLDVSSNSAFEMSRDTCTALVTFRNRSTTDRGFPVNYLWVFGDGTSSARLEDTAVVSHQYPRSGTYTVSLVSGYLTPCADTSSITFVYDSTDHLLRAAFSLDNAVLCAPASFHAHNETHGGQHFRWYVNGVLKDTTRDLHDSARVDEPITITLVVTDSSKCKIIDTLSKSITPGVGSDADFSVGRDSCSLFINFTNLTTSGKGVPYKWYFGDGDSSSESNPTHSYKKTDNYTITLISNPGPCADTVSKTFYIDGDTSDQVIIPNVFTPDGDGLNDLFQVRGVSEKCDEFHIWIYNRWENLFFESSNPSFSWNGRNEKGVEASEGVYFYVIDIKKRSGKHIHTRGTITLITRPPH